MTTPIRGFLWALVLVMVAAIAARAGTLEKIRLGEHWSGPPIKSTEELRGRVVVIERWGYNCPPCRASLPHLAKLQDRYRERGLVIIGDHVQNVPREQVLMLCRQSGVNYTITSFGGEIPGNRLRGIPQAFVFDHTGEMVFQGRPADPGFEKSVESAIAKAPDYITLGRKFSRLKSEAASVEKRRSLGKQLASCRKKAASGDYDVAEEAAYLRDRLLLHAEFLRRGAEFFETLEPARGLAEWNALARAYKGDEIGARAKKHVAELKKNKAFQAELKAERMLAALRKMAERFGQGSKKKDREIANAVRGGLATMKKKYPDAKATAQAGQFAATLEKAAGGR